MLRLSEQLPTNEVHQTKPRKHRKAGEYRDVPLPTFVYKEIKRPLPSTAPVTMATSSEALPAFCVRTSTVITSAEHGRQPDCQKASAPTT